MSLINDALKRASRASGQPPRQNTPSVALQPVESLRPRRSPAVIIVPSLAIIFLAGAFVLFLLWHRSQRENPAGRTPVEPVAGTYATATIPPQPPPPIPQPEIQSKPAPPAVKPKASQPPNEPVVDVASGASVEQRNLARLTNKVVTRIVMQPQEQPQPVAAPPVEQRAPVAIEPLQPPQTEVPPQRPPAAPVPMTPPISQPQVVVSQQVTTPAPPAAAPSAPPLPKPQPVEWPKIKLQGIFYSENPSAMINDRVVGVGEEIEEAKVLSIERRSVKLQFRGETKEWKLNW